MEYRWYAIQTTAGHENKVRSLLQKRIEDDPRPAEQKLIRQALVPVQDVIEIKNGKKITVERKLYPGYVLVEMQMSQEAQLLCMMAGANSLFYGDKLLTTGNPDVEVDRELFARLGLHAQGEAGASPRSSPRMRGEGGPSGSEGG